MFWSVMIPTYDPKPNHFEQMLRSVLSQDPGSDAMQIDVVDDCSTQVDVRQMVGALADGRVRFSSTSENKGLAGCWNKCIDQAQGKWVHILHQDDYVLPGFYEEIARIARFNPDAGLIATRSFFVDDEGAISGVSPRIRSLEHGGCTIREFLYDNQLQCPGVVISTGAYRKYGNFRTDLTYTLDWEMWTRIIGQAGGVVSPKVLSCYRTASNNMTSRLSKNAETLRDRARINRIFAERFKEFDAKAANERLCDVAFNHAHYFKLSGEHEAAEAYLKYWRRNAPLSTKARRYVGAVYRKVKRAFSKLRK